MPAKLASSSFGIPLNVAFFPPLSVFPFNISPGCTNTAEQDLAIHLGTDLEGLENGVIEACKSVTPHHLPNWSESRCALTARGRRGEELVDLFGVFSYTFS